MARECERTHIYTHTHTHVSVSPSGQGPVSVVVRAGISTSLGAITIADTAPLSVVFDSVAPVATVTLNSELTAEAEQVEVKILWSEAVSGFTAAGLSGTGLTFSEPVAATAANTFLVTATRAAGATELSVVRGSFDAFWAV